MSNYKNTDIKNVLVDTDDNVFIVMFKHHDTWVELHNSRNAKKYCRILSTVEEFLGKTFSLVSEKNELISALEKEFSYDNVLYLEKSIERDNNDDYLEIDAYIKKLTPTIYLDECLDVYIVHGDGFEDCFCYIFGQRRECYAKRIDSLLKARNLAKLALNEYKKNGTYNIQDEIRGIQERYWIDDGES